MAVPEPLRQEKQNEFKLEGAALTQVPATLLVRELAVFDERIRTLSDPDMQDVGVKLLEAVAAIGVTEKIDADLYCNAAYNTFLYPPNAGEASFINSISYGLPALENVDKAFAARCHEFIHARQYHHAAILHADPFNAATDVFLSPAAYLLRKERIEQDAYAKGAWLCSLTATPEMVTAMDSIMVSVSQFQRLRGESSSLDEALKHAAMAAGETMGKWFKDNDHVFSSADLWHEHALKEYESIIKARIKTGKPFTLVRMTDDDIREIGHSFGPNPFAGDDVHAAFGVKLNLTPEHQARLDELNKTLGVYNEGALPTLDEALSTKGMDKQTLQTASRSKPPILSVVKRTAPPPSQP